MGAKRSLVHKRLTKARRDLLSVKHLARGKDPYLDTAIYHCQQTAEKAIKGGSFITTNPLKKLMTCGY